MTEIIVGVNDTLTKVSKYELIRNGGQRIPIEVHRVIAGRQGNAFIAVPVGMHTAKQKYFGKGRSEEEALQNCINLMWSVPVAEVFNSPSAADPEEGPGS